MEIFGIKRLNNANEVKLLLLTPSVWLLKINGDAQPQVPDFMEFNIVGSQTFQQIGVAGIEFKKQAAGF